MAGTQMMVFDSIARSNIPEQRKSAILRAYESATGMEVQPHHLVRAGNTLTEAGQILRQGGETLGVGFVLGLINANMKNGLDINTGIDGMGAPLDGIAAGLGYLGAMGLAAMGKEHLSQDMRNGASTALGILTFRKTSQFVAQKKIAAGGTVGSHLTSAVAGERSDIGEDPIAALAKSMGGK